MAPLQQNLNLFNLNIVVVYMICYKDEEITVSKIKPWNCFMSLINFKCTMTSVRIKLTTSVVIDTDYLYTILVNTPLLGFRYRPIRSCWGFGTYLFLVFCGITLLHWFSNVSTVINVASVLIPLLWNHMETQSFWNCATPKKLH